MSTLKSEQMVVSSPMSFSGATKRIINITKVNNVFAKWFLAVPIAVILLLFMYVVIAAWYACFGILVVPWRILRRGQRKSKKTTQQHREVMDSIQKNN